MHPRALFTISLDLFEDKTLTAVEVYSNGEACHKSVDYGTLGNTNQCIEDMGGEPVSLGRREFKKYKKTVADITFQDSGKFEENLDGVFRIDTYQQTGSEKGIFRWGKESAPKEVEKMWDELISTYESADSGL